MFRTWRSQSNFAQEIAKQPVQHLAATHLPAKAWKLLNELSWHSNDWASKPRGPSSDNQRHELFIF